MKRLLRITAWIDWLSAQAAKVAISLVLLCVIVSVLNAFSRYLFDSSSNAWLELQWYMFGGIILLGGAHLLNTNGHIRVDLFYIQLSERRKLYLDLFGLGFFVIPFCIAMTVYAWPWFLQAWYLQEISANAGGLLRWPVKLLLPLGFSLLVLQACAEIIKRLAALRGEYVVDTHYERPEQ